MNPYLREWQTVHGTVFPQHLRSLDEHMRAIVARERLVEEYAWAVPTAEAIRSIAKHAPIVEIGAGTGYWAHLLEEEGVEVVAYDAAPPDISKNEYRHKRTYTTVLKGGPDKVADHPQHTLMLCWPPYRDPMASHCLKNYAGSRLIFIGEVYGGCCGGAGFWKQIREQWDGEDCIELPQYPGIHDALYIFGRRNEA